MLDVIITLIIGLLSGYLIFKWMSPNPDLKTDTQPPKESKRRIVEEKSNSKDSVSVLYSTQSGTSRLLAETLLTNSHFSDVELILTDLKDYDIDDLPYETNVIFIISTWSEGEAVPSSKWFFDWLREHCSDFRVSKKELQNLKFKNEFNVYKVISEKV